MRSLFIFLAKVCLVKKYEVVQLLLGERLRQTPGADSAKAFAPTNIALCKYWGKRNTELNLPITSSLSIALRDQGATVALARHAKPYDHIILNGKVVSADSTFSQKLSLFLDLFRGSHYFHIQIESHIPIAAGLASSACGFASIVLALDQLFAWQLSPRELSILARLGSGSASRSIYPGFVEWHAGVREDGMDSYAEPLADQWPELRIGLLMVSEQEKTLSSREAMQRTLMTSALYAAWPQTVARDLAAIKQAIASKDFLLLAKTAESNAMAMHATMLSAWPPILYAYPETVVAMQKIWQLRRAGLSLYFTQDAGPNLKLLFRAQDTETVSQQFSLKMIKPF